MRNLGGLTLLTGIGVALFVYLPTPIDSAASLDSLQRIVASRSAQLPRVKVIEGSRLGTFSPSIALQMPAQSQPSNAGGGTTATLTRVGPSPVPIAWDAQAGWKTIVSPTTPVPLELSPRDPSARYRLVLEIQQELRRVGCYWGRMDGSWEYAIKNAMTEFTDRVNATLPLDQPDYIQLALIQSQRHGVCGACPAGQSLTASGRCVGVPATARTVAAAQREVLPWKAKALFKPVLSSNPLPGWMAIGGPVPTSDHAQQGAPSAAPGIEPTPPQTQTAALETASLDAAAIEPPVMMVAPKAVRRSSSSRRVGRNHSRRFASGPPRARSYRRGGTGTPRHNLLLSLGGVY